MILNKRNLYTLQWRPNTEKKKREREKPSWLLHPLAPVKSTHRFSSFLLCSVLDAQKSEQAWEKKSGPQEEDEDYRETKRQDAISKLGHGAPGVCRWGGCADMHSQPWGAAGRLVLSLF